MFKKIYDYLIAHIPNLLSELGRWMRYLYFMRFSILLWVFPLLLVLANHTGAKSLTSGLLVPEYWEGYLCVAFFLVSTGFVALIAARIPAINGPDRWGEVLKNGPELIKNICDDDKGGREQKWDEAHDDRPKLLKKLFVNDKGEWEWVAPLASQVLNLYVFWYLFSNATSQQVPWGEALGGLLGGAAIGVLLWYLANAWYYLTFEAPPTHAALTRVVLGKNAARTILFPRRWFFLNRAHGTRAAVTIEDASTSIKGAWEDSIVHRIVHFIERFADLSGYRNDNGQLYEAHQFSLVAVLGFVGLYATVWPLAAPVTAFVPSIVALVVTGIALIRIDWVFWSAKHGGRRLRRWKFLLIAGATGFWVIIAGLFFFSDSERFPILAVVLIMTIAVCWALSGIAFFVDRFRVPVLTLLVIAMIVPRLPFLPLTGSSEEHYFSTVPAKIAPPAPVPTPAEILDERLPDPTDDRPLIIVTATGGGLHASAWTVTVLAHLEEEFAKNHLGPPEPFHKHLLLLSTVSGGSVGLLSYMREIQDAETREALQKEADKKPVPLDLTRMKISAQCSSLEAVGWGLVYYDFTKAFLPIFPYFVSPSSGDGDLDRSPLFKDRTWSLRTAFGRNLNNDYCEYTWKRDTGQPLPHGLRFLLNENRNAQALNDNLESRLTFRALLPEKDNRYPAITMNTTSVEEGNRFLLANYRVPHYSLDSTLSYPAQSFLDDFGKCNPTKPDLPLVTAAQLSATFPYVSSAARVAKSVDCQSVHFVDGGYYDNDGTVSAIEFLRYALAAPPPDIKNNPDPQDIAHLQSIQAKLKGHPLHILWLEIRNSGDYDGGAGQTSGGNGASTDPWNMFSQLAAPAEGFWNAGNVAVTGRNRMALGLLDQAFAGSVEIHRIILTDTDPSSHAGTDPLNWSLTPRQRTEVRKSAEGIAPNYREAKCWFSHWDEMTAAADLSIAPPKDFAECPALPKTPVPAARH
jgi:hypothetical protein